MTARTGAGNASASIRHRLSGAGRGYLAMMTATVAMSFVVQVWLARSLGPAGLGAYTATSLFVVVLTTVTFSGISFAISQRIARLDEDGDARLADATSTAFALALVATLMSAALAAAVWRPFARSVDLPGSVSDGFAALAVGSAVVTAFAGSVLLAHLRFRAATAVYLIQPAAVATGLLLRPILLFDGSSLAALGFVGAGSAALALLLIDGVRPAIRKAEAILLLRRSLPSSIVPYSSLLTTWLDRAVVIAISGATGLGWFAAASYVTEGILRIPRGLGALGVPAYARLVEDRVGARRLLDSQIRIIASFLLIAGAGIVGGGGGLIIFIFREDFVLGRTALRLLAISLVPIGIALMLAGNAVGTERFRHVSKVMLVLAPIQLTGVVLGTSWFSIAGTAAAEVAVWTFAVILFAVELRGEQHALAPSTLIRIAAVSLPSWEIAWLLGNSTLAWPAAGVAAALIAAFGVVVFVLRGPDWRVLSRLLALDQSS